MKLNRRVTIITRFSGIMFSLLLLGGLAACSDDNNGSDTPEPEPSTYPTTPFSKIELKEVIESDAQPVTATHTYLYNSAGRLTGYTGKQSFTAGDELFEIENTTTVEYKDHQAVITDEAGTVSTYTLNDKGYATTCTSQDMAGNTRTYTFSYLINTEDKYYLENITEKLDDGKEYIIRKTKCFDFWERNVLFPKTKRSFFRTPKHPLPCPFPLNFSLLIITKKFGNLAKNRYICIV